MKNEFRDEPLPALHTDIYDPISDIYFVVHADRKLSFNEAKKFVVKFMLARATQYDQDIITAHDAMPPHVNLVIHKDGQVTAPHLSDPETIKNRREAAKVRREKQLKPPQS